MKLWASTLAARCIAVYATWARKLPTCTDPNLACRAGQCELCVKVQGAKVAADPQRLSRCMCSGSTKASSRRLMHNAHTARRNSGRHAVAAVAHGDLPAVSQCNTGKAMRAALHRTDTHGRPSKLEFCRDGSVEQVARQRQTRTRSVSCSGIRVSLKKPNADSTAQT